MTKIPRNRDSTHIRSLCPPVDCKIPAKPRCDPCPALQSPWGPGKMSCGTRTYLWQTGAGWCTTFFGLAMVQMLCESRLPKSSERGMQVRFEVCASQQIAKIWPKLGSALAWAWESPGAPSGECRARLAPVCDRQVQVGARHFLGLAMM